MLINGAKLGYHGTTGATSFTDIAGLKNVPDMGAAAELVDNTALSDNIVHNEIGIGDSGDMEYTFRYDNSSATSNYRVCKGLEGTEQVFQQSFADGTKFTFNAIPSVRVSGGGVNDPAEFVMTLAMQSDITVANPA